MPRLLILGLLLYIAWRLLRNLMREKIRRELRQEEQASREQVAEDVLMEDPVCHALIPKRQAVHLRQDGKNYYFCSEACCDQFTGRKEGATE